MAIEASALGGIAARLAEAEGGSEIIARTVANRAYYWAFHVAQEYANRNGYRRNSQRSRNSHHDLWNWFSSEKRREIARLGFALKKYRHVADYSLQKDFNISESELLEMATELCELVRAAP